MALVTAENATLLAIATLSAGEIGMIHTNMTGGDNPALGVDRKFERTIDIRDFPTSGFKLYSDEMTSENAALKDKVITVKGEKQADGKVVFSGDQSGSPLCKGLNFEMTTTVRTVDGPNGKVTNFDIIFKRENTRDQSLTLTNLPFSVRTGVGLFVEGDANLKMGCDLLLNDGKSDTVYVARYSDKAKLSMDMSQYMKNNPAEVPINTLAPNYPKK